MQCIVPRSALGTVSQTFYGFSKVQLVFWNLVWTGSMTCRNWEMGEISAFQGRVVVQVKGSGTWALKYQSRAPDSATMYLKISVFTGKLPVKGSRLRTNFCIVSRDAVMRWNYKANNQAKIYQYHL